MNFAVAGVKAGIMTQNEAREYMGMKNLDGADELISGKAEPIGGQSPQDTGGGGGQQRKKMNLGK